MPASPRPWAPASPRVARKAPALPRRMPDPRRRRRAARSPCTICCGQQPSAAACHASGRVHHSSGPASVVLGPGAGLPWHRAGWPPPKPPTPHPTPHLATPPPHPHTPAPPPCSLPPAGPGDHVWGGRLPGIRHVQLRRHPVGAADLAAALGHRQALEGAPWPGGALPFCRLTGGSPPAPPPLPPESPAHPLICVLCTVLPTDKQGKTANRGGIGQARTPAAHAWQLPTLLLSAATPCWLYIEYTTHYNQMCEFIVCRSST